MSRAKIRVGFFIDAYKPGAGTENQLRGILQHLDPSRVEAVLITLRDPVAEKHRTEIPWPVECLHVGSLYSPVAALKFFKLVPWLRKRRFDIAMIYFVDTNQFVVPACKLAGVRNIIVNRRDMGYWYTKSLLRRLNTVNRLADYFLVNSEAVRQLVAANERFPIDRVKVIYNGLWHLGKATGQLSKESLGIPADSSVVGIVANLRPVKRIDRFVDMAAQVLRKVPRAYFLVLGEGELEGQLKRQAADLGIAERIRFCGQVANVADYLLLFDVGALTSESEGLSNTLIEYAAAGVPAVAFDTGGNSEVVVENQTGYLVPGGDIPGMTGKVVEILTDNELKEKLSRGSLALAEARFAPDAIIRELTAFFDAIR